MSQNFPFFASLGGVQPQGQHNGQQPHLGTNSNLRLPAADSRPVAAGSVAPMAVTHTAGIDLTQFPPALVAQVLQAIQMGAIPMPPPHPPQVPPKHTMAPMAGFQQTQATTTASAPDWKGPKSKEPTDYHAAQGKSDDVDMDREDGEVVEGEVGLPLNVHGSLYPPPTGPQGRGITPRSEAGTHTHVLGGRDGLLPAQASTLGPSRLRKESEPKEFIYVLHEAGYTFADLAKELGDTKPLRRIYQQLGLPASTEQAAVIHAPPSNVEPRKTSLSKRSIPPKAAPPSDRTEYLKRLAAARNKTPAKAAAPSPPHMPPTEPSTALAAPPVQQNASTPVQAGPSSKKPIPKIDEATAAAKRLLLKERLEALKAKQAAKLTSVQNAASRPIAASMSTSATDAAASSTPFRASNSDISTTAASPTTTYTPTAASEAISVMPSQIPAILPMQMTTPSPVPSYTPFRGLPGLQAGRLPGLPGLSARSNSVTHSPQPNVAQPPVLSHVANAPSAYDGGPTVSSPNSSTQPENTLVIAKRAAGSDFEMPTGAPRRPFGSSRKNSNTEQFIIHASEDEDEDEEADDNHISASNAGNGSLSQIEANVQKLKEKIAAIELAKSSRSNGSTPVGSMFYLSDNANAGTTQPLINNDRLPSKDLTSPKASGSKGLSPRASLGVMNRSSVGSIEHLEQHDSLAPATSHSQHLGDDQFNVAPRAVSSGRSSSFEDFYGTDDHAMISSTLNYGRGDPVGAEDLASQSQVRSEYIPAFDGAGCPHDNPKDDNGATSQNQSTEVPVDAAASDRTSQNPSSGEIDSDDGKEAFVADSFNGNVDDTVVHRPSSNTVSKPSPISAQDAMDLDEASSDDDGNSSIASSRDSEETDEDEYEPGDLASDSVPVAISGPSSFSLPMKSTSTGGILAPELQPPLSEALSTSIQEPKKYFKPYVSHLTGFKDFRYHPDFLKVVPAGYKSLTYSNKIDPHLAFCPRESIGEECNDPGCQWQHYNSTALNDNELLMSLGMAHPPVNNDEEKQRWKDGLGTLIKQLRLSKMGSDVNVIAAHICDYRRKFIGDDSKIIHLGS